MSKKPSVLTICSDVEDVKGFGPQKVKALGKLGIHRICDVWEYYPRSYVDFRNPKLISQLVNDERCLVVARVLLIRPGKGYGRKRNLRLLVEDKSGRMEVLFFSAGFMSKSFTQGEEYRFYGKVKAENGKYTMFHPTYEKVDDQNTEGILPVYPLVSGISQKDLRKLALISTELLSEGLSETLPEGIINKANLCSNNFAIRNIHFPQGEKEYSQARYRLVYEELFDLKAAILLSGNRFGGGRTGISICSGKGKEFISNLKYNLTNAQSRTVEEIIADMNSSGAMNRLLQGDVGSGKTIVAEAAMAEAAGAGYQSAFMAPTELLAKQHYETLSADFSGYGITVELLTGAISSKDRRSALERIESGESKIIVGTHAVISESVKFCNLGLVITDEQHRFGVNQRQLLAAKGQNPDVLVMTATPIPRTLAVVLYGDLEISVIDELPPGRKEIITREFNESNRSDAYKILTDEISKGRQAYIVAPFIDDSEALDGYSAEGLYRIFTKEYPMITCEILHSGISDADKNRVMSDFYEGKISVLISTVVIEVGINVPNATVMLIENAERFGLAQMHQLRGRVGRGSHQSYCLIVTGEASDVSRERSAIMCNSSNGFEIAEKDLEIRGPGEIFGYRQHGLPQLKLADPVKHIKIVEAAGKDAQELLNDDPGLNRGENRAFAERIRTRYLKADNLTL